MPVGYIRVLWTAFILQQSSDSVSYDNISLYMHTALATVPDQYQDCLNISKSIMYLILSAGSWCHEATFTAKG